MLTWSLLGFISIPSQRHKTWRRVLADTAFRWMLITQRISFIGTLIGPSAGTYASWCKKNSMEPCVENIEGGTQLFWIGDKRPEKLILYLHGGGFSLPIGYYSIRFWRYIQRELQASGCGVSIAILNYDLVPKAQFPVPLAQTVASVHHLLSNGIRPENIQLTGDSAGGNLVLQLLLHMLHPQKGIRVLSPGIRFRGAYLMSPWMYLTPRDGVRSYIENAGKDVVPSKEKYAEFGAKVLSGIMDREDLQYIDASHMPQGWYENIGSVIDRLLNCNVRLPARFTGSFVI
ncbi:Alpha/Beta hydrolase protein [Gymnopilus junonius]|uniref:Alpha/Beta hydrolase protein n=1 Tax=Gymnopilus junonius TaxID=109634 RepID=A0A9P5NMR3_GYMJU|nr:Alpha/Beta hydrolase protein [Gymnopilus junonius]